MAARYSGAAFTDRFGPWAVIAGGSDGIGAAFAREVAARGLNIALIARRPDPLETFAHELAKEFAVETRAIPTDLTESASSESIASATADLDVGLLVYNAGSSRGAQHFLDGTVDDAIFQVDLSCQGPVRLAHHFGGRLRARKRGGLVLMSSMASLAGNGYQATYAASKAFDTTFAEGLWIELAPEGVDVLGVLAGATRTETMLEQRFEEFAGAMDPAEVARGALDHLGKGPNWIPGADNQAAAKGLWPVPRVAVVNAMTQATSALFDREFSPVAGKEFHEDD